MHLLMSLALLAPSPQGRTISSMSSGSAAARVKTRFDEVTQAIADKADRKKLLEQFLHTVETQEPVTQFDERLWSSLVDFVTVYSEKDIRVTFKDGTEIQV